MKNLFFLCLVFYIFSCKKKNDNPSLPEKYGFEILESVGDTMLIADSVYEKRKVGFRASDNLMNCSWKIGNKNYQGSFVTVGINEPGVFTITLTATKKNILEPFSMAQNLVVLPINSNTVSPLVGKFSGKIDNDKNNLIDIEFKYWYGSRYPWWDNGAYTLNNLPKGYSNKDQNWNSFSRPEIDGIIISAGYKNFSINMEGVIPALGIKAYGSIRRGNPDTLFLNYSIYDPKFLGSGINTYIKYKFSGLRK